MKRQPSIGTLTGRCGHASERRRIHDSADQPGAKEVSIDEPVFEGYVEDELFVQVGGVELDKLDPDDRLSTYKRAFRGRPVDDGRTSGFARFM